MTAPGFDPPEKRWDDDYSCTEFVPQEPEVFERIAAQLERCETENEEVGRLLGQINLSKWKGAAADVFTTYLTTLTDHFRTVRDEAGSCAEAVSKCGRAVTAAYESASGAVTELNTAQAKAKKIIDEKGIFALLIDPEGQQAVEDFNDAYDRAKESNDFARTALENLARDLDAHDATLAGLDAPTPPSPTFARLLGIVTPEEAELLDLLFKPVNNALEDDGATDAADDQLRELRDVVDGSDDDRREALGNLAELSPEEMQYVLDHMDEDDIAALFGSLDPDKDRETYNAIAANAPAELLKRLADTDPNHYWHPYTGDGGPFAWQDPSGLEPGEIPSGDPSELQQGMLGDCHVLASLAAAEQADPGFLERNVHANANGTYTVTLYKDGEKIEVVVTPEVPFTMNSDGSPNDGAFTHGSENDDQSWTDQATLYQIYEKALAQSWGEIDPNDDGRSGYDGMDGGWSENDLPVITGNGTDKEDSDDVSADDMREYIAEGRPLTVSSLQEDDVDGRDLYDESEDRFLVSGHAYYVIDVTDDGHVVLGNPHGQELPGSGTVTLTWDEFQDATSQVTVGD